MICQDGNPVGAWRWNFFYEISPVCLFEMPRQNHHSLEPHNHQCFEVTLRDHHGICLGYICQIWDLPLILLMEQIRRSPVDFGSLSQYLPRVLYIPGGCGWNFWTINNISNRKMQETRPFLRKKKRRALYTQVGPKHPEVNQVSKSKKSHRYRYTQMRRMRLEYQPRWIAWIYGMLSSNNHSIHAYGIYTSPMLRTGTFMKQAAFSKPSYAHCRIGVAMYESSLFVVSGVLWFLWRFYTVVHVSNLK